jgi:plasmid stability protein
MCYNLSMKRIMIRDVPDDIHKDFRIMCLKKDVSMNQELLRMIKEAVEKYRKSKIIIKGTPFGMG